jgi:LuxR family maltose regulon positive regulatory protein
MYPLLSLTSGLVSRHHKIWVTWLERAERPLRADLEPAVGVSLRWTRGGLELARGRLERALDAFQSAEGLAELLLTPYVNVGAMRAQALQTLVRLGQADRVETALAEMADQQRDPAFMRSVIAALRLAGDDPQAAALAPAPAIAGSVPAGHPIWSVEALLLEAAARDALGDPDAAGRALERTLDLAEPDHILHPFLVHPAPGLLERHARHRTAYATLIAEILALLRQEQRQEGTPGGQGGGQPVPRGVREDGSSWKKQRPAPGSPEAGPSRSRAAWDDLDE